MLKLNKLALSVVSALALSTSVNADSYEPRFDVDMQQPSGVQTNPLAPGIIVKYKSANKSLSVKQSIKRAEAMGKAFGVNLKFKRMMSGNAEVLSILPNQEKSFNRNKLKKMVDALNKRPDVEYAEIDALVIPYLTPNDTAYNTQWHYFENTGGMRLPAAWDTTTGSSAVTVAVLDTGYRPHADLAAQVIGQYDMISSVSVAGDGDGRDGSAQDPGDFTTAGQCSTGSAASNSSWHGTHVSGTVAAVSNNNSDVTGVAWNVNLLPVRVLGRCGGSLSDIADGIRWASGLSVVGTPTNTHPAQVINMSLGSGSPAACSNSYQSAITAAVNAGVTVVVAAGNSNSSSGYPPANCTGVVAVGATNRKGGRAYYSNFGSVIDVSAPGGDGCQPLAETSPASLADCEGGVWSNANMIQSTYNTGTTTPGADSIGALQGTSMASPHVAGLAALMYSVKPTATSAEIESTLKATARAFPTVNSHQCTTANCGAGIVDANAAVLAMGSNPPPPPPPTSNVLSNGVAVTGLSGATGNDKFYTMVVPSGASGLNFALTLGSGDPDLYVKFGANPTTSSYDCRSWKGAGQNELCSIASVQAGTYHVLVHSYAAYSATSLTGNFTTPASNVVPTAAFTSSCTNLTCSFDGSGSNDTDGTISNYSWSFGGTGVTASKTYASAGTYAVTLTVTDNGGLTNAVTHNVTVTAPPANVAPTAAFTSSCTNLACSFNGSGSSDSDGTIASYSWSFGATGVTASNTYASAGTYAVTLTVTDNGGLTNTVTHNVTVTAPPVGNALINGVAATGLSASTGADIVYTMDVPAGASNIKFNLSGGSGDADMYVKFGSTPTDTVYDCRPYVAGNTESCTVTSSGGTYYVRIKAYSTYSGVSLVGSYTAAGSGPTAIDTTTSNISVGTGAWKHYTVNLGTGYSTLTVTMSGGTGDADLYVRQGAQSTSANYDCRPYKTGNSEVCTFNAPTSGTWYIDIRGYAAASGVSLRTQAN